MRAHRDDPRHHHVASVIRDPDEFFRRVPLLSNLETKLLASRTHDAETLDDDAIEDAKATLDKLAFGLTAEFEISTALFAERFDFDVPRFGTTNASASSGDRDLLSDDFRAAACAHNTIDVQLYDYAERLFERRVRHYVDTLLSLSLDQSPLVAALSSGSRHVGDVLTIGPTVTHADLIGWILVDDHPADAVLVRAGEETTPLCCRVFSAAAARHSRKAASRFAGVVGRVALPADIRAIELIAVDRTRQRRALRTVEVHRTEAADRQKSGARTRLRSFAGQALRSRRTPRR